MLDGSRLATEEIVLSAQNATHKSVATNKT